nr:MAG TPA: hypothetical protein [Bacteriophage sp.]
MNQMLNQSQKDSLSDGNRKRPIWSFVLHYLLFKFFLVGRGNLPPCFSLNKKNHTCSSRVVYL